MSELKPFKLRKKLLEEAKALDDQLLDTVKRSPMVQAFIIKLFIPWLEYARDLAIRAEYDSIRQGHPPTDRAAGFEAIERKMELLLKRAAPKKDEEK